MTTDRRTALSMLLAVSTAPMFALAQTAQRRVAWFGAGHAGTTSPFLEAFRAGLRETGWIEGQNLALSVFLTEGTPEDSERLARQMVATTPEVIVTFGRDVLAVRKAKPTGPVVFVFSGNPIDGGVVQSFARPGGNFTGISFMSLELAGKRIALLRELVPQAGASRYWRGRNMLESIASEPSPRKSPASWECSWYKLQSRRRPDWMAHCRGLPRKSATRWSRFPMQ